MKIRAVAASALALALAAGLTGCNMISPQRTTMEYAASDGVNVDLGDVHARNVLLLTDGTGSQANLVFTAVNTSGDDAQINLNIDGTAVNIPLPYTPGNDVTQVGFGDGGQQLVQGNFTTGTTVEVTFRASYTDADGARQTVEATHAVPVLGDDDAASVHEEYQTLLPTSGTGTPAGQ